MELAFGFLGGLALFIYGMQNMGEGLQKSAGNRMRKILEALTNVPVIGVLVGALVTSIIQSSSATTVMVIGFVNAGLITLKQSIGVIMGANIGTTITAQLISFKLTHFTLAIIAFGFILNFFAKKRTIKYLGQVLLGFGLLLLGMDFMKDAMAPLRDYPGFREFMTNFSRYPLLGLGVGIVMTVAVQSSSATIGILIAMASQGLLPLYAALPILLGDNIGTCITALLASIGTNLTAKRAALAHVLFNLVGSLIFLIGMKYFYSLVLYISPDNISRQIANAHASFNIMNTLLFLPFIGVFAKFIERMIPGDVVRQEPGAIYLDHRMLKTPAIALSLATKELIRMAELSKQNVIDAMQGFIHNDEKKLKEVFEREDIIDNLEEAITAYLAHISQKGLSPELSIKHTGLLHAVNDIERIGDHAENIAQMASSKADDNIHFSDKAIIELREMADLALGTFMAAIEALEKDNKIAAQKAVEMENDVDVREMQLRRSHIGRLNQGECLTAAGIVFLDIISNLERVGDHSHNIATVVLGDI